MITAHADVVGSLLRPPELLKAQVDLAAGRITQPQFKTIEDRAVDDAIVLQEEAGLEVVTDGEMRRLSFQSQMTQAVEGLAAPPRCWPKVSARRAIRPLTSRAISMSPKPTRNGY